MGIVRKVTGMQPTQSLGVQQSITETYIVKHTYSIRLLLFIFKFLGLAPISINHLSSRQSKRQRLPSQNLMFKKCIFGLVYIYILIIIVMTAAVFTMPLLNAGPQREADLLNSATTIKGVFGITVTIVIWLIIIAQSKMAVKILNRIVEMDKEMLIVQNLCADKSKIQIVIMFMGNCTIWISIFVLEILVVSDWYNVWTPLLLPSMIMNWYIMQYVFMLVMVESRAGSVNRGFIMIAKGRLAAFMYSNPRHTDANERKLVNNFMILRRGHAILAGICRDLSDYYSFPVLPTISFLCCATIYDSYYLILPLVVPSNYTSILEISNMICWLLMETLPVVVLAVYVTRVLNEMEKTGSIVYNVLSRSALIHIAKNELMDFSVELLHRKVRFTAYGIFSLDGTLIRSIFGMLVTYLIILMQFQLNHRSDDELKLVTTSSTISPMSSA